MTMSVGLAVIARPAGAIASHRRIYYIDCGPAVTTNLRPSGVKQHWWVQTHAARDLRFLEIRVQWSNGVAPLEMI